MALDQRRLRNQLSRISGIFDALRGELESKMALKATSPEEKDEIEVVVGQIREIQAAFNAEVREFFERYVRYEDEQRNRIRLPSAHEEDKKKEDPKRFKEILLRRNEAWLKSPTKSKYQDYLDRVFEKIYDAYDSLVIRGTELDEDGIPKIKKDASLKKGLSKESIDEELAREDIAMSKYGQFVQGQTTTFKEHAQSLNEILRNHKLGESSAPNVVRNDWLRDKTTISGQPIMKNLPTFGEDKLDEQLGFIGTQLRKMGISENVINYMLEYGHQGDYLHVLHRSLVFRLNERGLNGGRKGKGSFNQWDYEIIQGGKGLHLKLRTFIFELGGGPDGDIYESMKVHSAPQDDPDVLILREKDGQPILVAEACIQIKEDADGEVRVTLLEDRTKVLHVGKLASEAFGLDEPGLVRWIIQKIKELISRILPNKNLKEESLGDTGFVDETLTKKAAEVLKEQIKEPTPDVTLRDWGRTARAGRLYVNWLPVDTCDGLTKEDFKSQLREMGFKDEKIIDFMFHFTSQDGYFDVLISALTETSVPRGWNLEKPERQHFYTLNDDGTVEYTEKVFVRKVEKISSPEEVIQNEDGTPILVAEARSIISVDAGEVKIELQEGQPRIIHCTEEAEKVFGFKRPELDAKAEIDVDSTGSSGDDEDESDSERSLPRPGG